MRTLRSITTQGIQGKINMMFNLDKRTFELLNKAGYKITFEQFRDVYKVRMEERYNDPKAVAKRAKEQKENEAYLEAYRLELAKEKLEPSSVA
jgi:hypothetical protein